jgi:hypothetical protein
MPPLRPVGLRAGSSGLREVGLAARATALGAGGFDAGAWRVAALAAGGLCVAVLAADGFGVVVLAAGALDADMLDSALRASGLGAPEVRGAGTLRELVGLAPDFVDAAGFFHAAGLLAGFVDAADLLADFFVDPAGLRAAVARVAAAVGRAPARGLGGLRARTMATDATTASRVVMRAACSVAKGATCRTDLGHQCRHIVLLDDVVAGQQRQPFVSSLRDQQAVKWISMVPREIHEGVSVFGGDRERLEWLFGEDVGEFSG